MYSSEFWTYDKEFWMYINGAGTPYSVWTSLDDVPVTGGSVIEFANVATGSFFGVGFDLSKQHGFKFCQTAMAGEPYTRNPKS